tara:strand:- start:3300 stop:3557 length:258 start_codon:yes stop_codon:yes gene_type:complete
MATSTEAADSIEIATSTESAEKNPTNQIQNPSSPWTALNEPMRDTTKMRFFGMRFMTVWVFPIAITGIVMEFLFVGPLRNVNPFN